MDAAQNQGFIDFYGYHAASLAWCFVGWTNAGQLPGQHQVDALMQSVDLVCVPSIWWENSPVVIQEALRNRVPIVCSNIRGMAGKVRDGMDGVHFVAANAHSLAQTVARLAADADRIDAQKPLHARRLTESSWQMDRDK